MVKTMGCQSAPLFFWSRKVNNLLEKLVTLQKLDLEIRKLGHALQQIPKRMLEIDRKIESTKVPFEEAKKKIDELKKKADLLAEEVIKLEVSERELKLKMPKIKSNEEYSALLKEMDTAKKKKDDFEEEQLTTIEEIESLEKELPSLEKKYLEQENGVKGERDELEKEKREIESLLIKKKEERNLVLPSIPKNYFEKYTHIASARNGLAVAPVRRGICQGCFIGVRPKIVQDLHYGEEIVYCEGCQRFLYLDEES